MIKTLPKTETMSVMDAIDTIVAQYGPRRVLLAAMKAALRRRSRPLHSANDLPDSLRRDLGLSPLPQKLNMLPPRF